MSVRPRNHHSKKWSASTFPTTQGGQRNDEERSAKIEQDSPSSFSFLSCFFFIPILATSASNRALSIGFVAAAAFFRARSSSPGPGPPPPELDDAKGFELPLGSSTSEYCLMSQALR